MTATAPAAVVPYRGLNHFDERHGDLFFGRDEQLRDLLVKLQSARFVTVVGSSGTGKSSLVRAALIPAVRAGFLMSERPEWSVVTMTPGSSPIGNLAAALQKVFGTPGLELTLRRGGLGLVEAMRQSRLAADESLLVFVDQFEELFRYQRVSAERAAATEEAAAFVRLLLEATASPDSPICVVLTMRYDYLGACAQFRDLPERINSGLYLIPRMRRDDMEDAITGPAAVAGGRFAPALVQRLLNDVGEDPDQLPVLQHALLRTWLYWKQATPPAPEIGFPHYERTGGVRDSINNHAEEIYAGLRDESDRRIAETVFKALTERDPANVDIRRPTAAGVIARIAGVSLADIERVTTPFRDQDVAFLKPPSEVRLHEDTKLDITHESLIRKWHRLGGRTGSPRDTATSWVHEEADLRDQYRDLLRRARAASASGAVLQGPDLVAALAWRRRALPAEWSRRYDDDPGAHAFVGAYLARSEARQEEKDFRARLRRAAYLVGAMVVAGAAGLAVLNSRDAREQERLRQRAENFREFATARLLAAKADALRDQNARPELSALLAIEGLFRRDVPEASHALRWPLALLRQPRWVLDGSTSATDANLDSRTSGAVLRFSPDGTHVGRITADGVVHLHRAADGGELPVERVPGYATSLAWAGNELRTSHVRSTTGNAEDPDEIVVIGQTPGSPGGREIAKTACSDSCLSRLTMDGTTLLFGNESPAALTIAGGRRRSLPGLALLEDGPLQLRLIRDSSGSAPSLVIEANGRQVGRIDGERDGAHDLGGTSPFLAWAAPREGVVRIYRKPPNFAQMAQLSIQSPVTALALSPNGQLLAVGTVNGEVRIVRWATQRVRAGWSHQSAIRELAFAPDVDTVVSMDGTGGLRVAPTAPPVHGAARDWVTLNLDTQRARAASFSPSGRFVAVQMSRFALSFLFSLSPVGETVRVFDTRSGAVVASLGSVDAFVFSADDRRMVASGLTGVQVVDLASGSVSAVSTQGALSFLPRFEFSTLLARPALGVSADGRYVSLRAPAARQVRGSEVNQQEARLRVIDVTTGAEETVPEAVAGMTSLVFSPDGRWAAGVRTERNQPAMAALIDRQSWTVAAEWPMASSLMRLAFGPDGRTLAISTSAGAVADIARTAQTQSLPSFRLIDTVARSERALDLPGTDTVSLLAFNRDGSRLAVAGPGASGPLVAIFDMARFTRLLTVPLDQQAERLAFDAASERLAVSAAGGIRLIAVTDGRDLGQIDLAPTERILGVHFPDGQASVAFVSEWRSDNAGEAVRDVGVRWEHLSREELLKEACARVTRPLTREEWNKYLPDAPESYRDTCKAAGSQPPALDR